MRRFPPTSPLPPLPIVTSETSIAALQDAAAQFDQPLTRYDYRSLEMSPGVPTLTDRFGTWNDAKRATGLEICQYGRTVPCHQENADGYMEWITVGQGTTHTVRVHRLLAVAKYGFEAVIDMDVHHIDGYKFYNTLTNIKTLTKTDHGKRHATMRRQLVNHDLREFF